MLWCWFSDLKLIKMCWILNNGIMIFIESLLTIIQKIPIWESFKKSNNTMLSKSEKVDFNSWAAQEVSMSMDTPRASSCFDLIDVLLFCFFSSLRFILFPLSSLISLHLVCSKRKHRFYNLTLAYVLFILRFIIISSPWITLETLSLHFIVHCSHTWHNTAKLNTCNGFNFLEITSLHSLCWMKILGVPETDGQASKLCFSVKY